MPNCLLIVESPAKAATIERYLRARPAEECWTVRATGGHLCDLPKERLGMVQEDGRFVADWTVSPTGQARLNELVALAKQADTVFLGADPDREGEKIAADVVRYAGLTEYRRIVFREIAPAAIFAAIDEQRGGVTAARVEAQIARRLVDRAIGDPLSQVLAWDFKRQGRPALPRGIGRVIAPALALLAEAERNIDAFVPQTHWRLAVEVGVAGETLRLLHTQKLDRASEAEALERQVANAIFQVCDLRRACRDVAPYPPLTTARLQRNAFYLFGFAPERTMQLAQELYEGVDLPAGRTGLITYPRTDSHALSTEAAGRIIALLAAHLDPDLVATQPRVYPNRAGTQGAHEAIRPVRFEPSAWPKAVAESLSEDAATLYDFIWRRTLQTQMVDAVYDASVLEVDADGERFRVRANNCLFEGWEHLNTVATQLGETDETQPKPSPTVRLPRLAMGDRLRVERSLVQRIERQCPPRYGVGRFLTTLDQHGLARPSTLDTVVRSLTAKGYVEAHAGQLRPTTLGIAVDAWLTRQVPWLNTVESASSLEQALDAVERGELERDALIGDYVQRIEALKTALGYRDASARAERGGAGLCTSGRRASGGHAARRRANQRASAFPVYRRARSARGAGEMPGVRTGHALGRRCRVRLPRARLRVSAVARDRGAVRRAIPTLGGGHRAGARSRQAQEDPLSRPAAPGDSGAVRRLFSA